MSSSGLSTWIYASFRRTKRRFQRLQRPVHYSFEPLDIGVSSAESALLPDVAATASSSSPRNSLNSAGEVDDGISNRANSNHSRPNSMVDATPAASVEHTVKYDTMMDSEPAASPKTAPPKAPFRKRNTKSLLSLRKKKKESSKKSPLASDPGSELASPPPPDVSSKQIQEKDEEIEKLRREMTTLQSELGKSEENFKRLTHREKILQDRLAAQALHVLEKSGKFENINSTELRPSQIVTMFQELYSQGRVDALDALDELEELEDFDDLKTKILYSVIVLSFRASKRTLDTIKSNVRQALQLPDVSSAEDALDDVDDDASEENRQWLAAKVVDDAITDWLRKTATTFRLKDCLKDVEEQLHATLFDFPSLKDCEALRAFIVSAIGVCWCCVVQNPPFVIEYQRTEFKTEWHQRFIAANPDNDKISSYVWPGLLDDENGACLVRGVVVT